MSTLFTLPEEVLIHILSVMHPTTLITCRAVCRILLDLIEQTSILKYHIELYADGMIDGVGCQLPVADRLSQLQTRRQAWKNMEWENHLIPLIPGEWNAYELVDGVFSKTLNTVTQHTARGILFASLPSRHNPGSVVIFEDVGITFRDFAMDPTQDLVVYMQCSREGDPDSFGLRSNVTLHFRTMTDNKIHPQARLPTVSTVFRSNISGAVIQTVNDVVGFMSWDTTHARLYIWDWKRCMQLVSETDLGVLDDFAFISDRAYVLTSPTPVPCLRVYTFDSMEDGYELPTPPSLRARLHLPALYRNSFLQSLGIHTGPFTCTSSMHPRRSKPFVTAPYARIHVLNVVVSSDPALFPTTCLICIRNKTFLSYVNKDGYQDIPWDDWGPSQTHWILGGTGSHWLRYVHGERLVRLSSDHDEPRVLEIYDFGAPRGPPSWLDPQIEDMSQQILIERLVTMFKSPPHSHLPYRVITKKGPFPYAGFMIDEDRLIGFKRHWDTNATSVDVFTF